MLTAVRSALMAGGLRLASKARCLVSCLLDTLPRYVRAKSLGVYPIHLDKASSRHSLTSSTALLQDQPKKLIGGLFHHFLSFGLYTAKDDSTPPKRHSRRLSRGINPEGGMAPFAPQSALIRARQPNHIEQRDGQTHTGTCTIYVQTFLRFFGLTSRRLTALHSQHCLHYTPLAQRCPPNHPTIVFFLLAGYLSIT